jgi:uncharacterized protein (DUF305 family)
MRSRMKLLIVAELVVLGGAMVTGCSMDQSEHGSSGGGHSSTSAPSATTASAERNDADIAFATGMIPHHQQAVEMAQLADERAVTPEIKSLVERIHAAQQAEIDQMTAWLTAWSAPVPSDEHGGHGSMPGMMTDEQMNQLRQLTGREFERQFLLIMIEHHQGAIEMARTELNTGANADAKALAQRTITDQQAEITEMQGLLSQA